jgi:adenosylcobinamide-GDP ribazoletransferase
MLPVRRWFPLVGMGGFYAAGLRGFATIFPPLVTAALLVAMEAILTGASFDGLADTADGFGSGHARRRKVGLRDTIGYGAVALILVITLKSRDRALIARPHADIPDFMPVLGRWSSVLLSATTLRAARRRQCVQRLGR